MIRATTEPFWARLCAGLAWVFAALSPFVLYFAVTLARIELAAAILLGFALLRAIPAVLGARREHRLAALRLPLVAIVSAGVGVVAQDHRALLALPSASQLGFGMVFLGSLRGTPLVEHFARMKAPALGPAQRRYCRTVTVVWGVVLVAAALVGFALAAWAPLRVWAAFTGVGSYVLVGVVFSAEYLTRKLRFREYGESPIDRVLARLFPRPRAVRALTGETSVTLPPDLVFFRGHFDGMPILPGVAQLTEIVLPAARRLHPELGALRGLRRVRFKRPILPGETLHVELEAERGAPGDLRFALRIDGAVVASGTMRFDVVGAS